MNEHANDARPKAKPKKPRLKEKSKAKATTLPLTRTSRLIEAAAVNMSKPLMTALLSDQLSIS
jgi:hypothetical protein